MTDDRSRWLASTSSARGCRRSSSTRHRQRRPADDPGQPRLLPEQLAWVVNAYMIPFGGLLLLAGRIGDLIGQRRVFLTGLDVFTAASLLCASLAEPGDADRGPLRCRGSAVRSPRR